MLNIVAYVISIIVVVSFILDLSRLIIDMTFNEKNLYHRVIKFKMYNKSFIGVVNIQDGDEIRVDYFDDGKRECYWFNYDEIMKGLKTREMCIIPTIFKLITHKRLAG